MSLTRASLTLAFLVCVSTLQPAIARAQASVAVLGGYGYEFEQGVPGQGLGFGARAGVTFPFHLYLGGTLTLYLGGKERGRSPTLFYENRRQEDTLAMDVGYDFSLWGRVLVRPYLTAGLLLDSEYTTLGARHLSGHELAGFVGPALAVGVKLGRWFAGVDGRAPIYPREFLPNLAVGAFAFAGATL